MAKGAANGSRLAAMSYLPISIPSGRGGPSASPEPGRRLTQPPAPIVVAVLRPSPSARRPPPAGGSTSAPRKAQDRESVRQRSPTMGWAVPISSSPSPASPISVTAAALWITRKACLGALKASSPDNSGGATASNPQRRRRQSIHRAWQGSSQQAAQLSVGPGHQNRFELGQPNRDNVHQLCPGLSHADTLWF